MPRRCEMQAADQRAASAAVTSTAPARSNHRLAQHALLQQPEGVGADAEEGAVAERRQPGGAEQQVVAEREQHPDHDLEREVLVQADLGEPQRRRRQQRPQQAIAIGSGQRGRRAARRAACGHAGKSRSWTEQNVRSNILRTTRIFVLIVSQSHPRADDRPRHDLRRAEGRRSRAPIPRSRRSCSASRASRSRSRTTWRSARWRRSPRRTRCSPRR